MKHTYLKHSLLSTFLFFFVMCLSNYTNAQDKLYSINASGNNVVVDAGSISYSVGQVFYSTMNDSDYLFYEGVQQTITAISTANEDVDIISPEIDVLIYPNPTKDFVTLKSSGLDFNKDNSYRVFNYQGKLINKKPIANNETQINLNYLSTGLYIIQVFVDEQLWKTFKILKQ
ncbi:T9SS type A sorting domain-containing protein [Tamlana sp. 62-3]|uniref:T9SS type A sorting domain-containing protein n=1 Tax=Neotamlana sargassicola TaxID=2883125 RepID=A0A9X1L7T8_9FLAO|nr:T9SS type A sorting domain-containing protein [Tamlana sargassicola]MCB4809226.1 T9SS type A sorting domain-containing protein [Tamlana sargassicola]